MVGQEPTFEFHYCCVRTEGQYIYVDLGPRDGRMEAPKAVCHYLKYLR